jgi:hypothetical protein
MRINRKLTPLASVLLVSGLVTGCAHPPRPPIQPWQREHLAKRALNFDEEGFRDHLYETREGAALGHGSPGGGCGCN